MDEVNTAETANPSDLQARVAALEAAVAELRCRDADYEQLTEAVAMLEKRPAGAEDHLSICCFSGALDRVIAAFIIATGAAAMGSTVDMYFTFWGTAAMRNPTPPGKMRKSLVGKMFGWMLPRGHRKLKLSQMNMAGAGPALIKRLMKKQNVASIDEMIELAAELGVRISICCMSMELMGLQKEEFIPYPNLRICGVAQFLEDSYKGRITLFI